MKAPRASWLLTGLAGLALVAGISWISGGIGGNLGATETLRATLTSTPAVDYDTDVVQPGSPFTPTRPTYDQ